MRNAFLILVLSLSLTLGLTTRAAEVAVSAQDQEFFNKQIGKLVKLEPKPLTGEALNKVFSARFFKLEVRIGSDGSGTDLVVARMGDEIFETTKPSTTADMPDLKSLIKADFKLKTQADAKVLEAALDLIYPIDERFDKDDLKVKAIKQDNTQWTFIRGKFFDDFKGFIIKTDANGAITSIQYSLDIKK